jgi:hypothetical protein
VKDLDGKRGEDEGREGNGKGEETWSKKTN